MYFSFPESLRATFFIDKRELNYSSNLGIRKRVLLRQVLDGMRNSDFYECILKSLTLTTPRDTFFLKKISPVGNWYFHLFKWGKITTWQEVQAISAKYEGS